MSCGDSNALSGQGEYLIKLVLMLTKSGMAENVDSHQHCKFGRDFWRPCSHGRCEWF